MKNTKANKTKAAAAELKAAAAEKKAAAAERYQDMLNQAKKLIKDNLTVKDATRSVRYTTAGFAVSFCNTFKSWGNYKSLFAQLKEDLKKDGIKFAGTPLSKACLAVSTAVIDCKLQIEGDTLEDKITFTKEAFKNAGVTFSSKQGDIRIGFDCPTVGDLEKASEEVSKEVTKALELIQKAGMDSVKTAVKTLQAWIERETKTAEKAEQIAKAEKAA